MIDPFLVDNGKVIQMTGVDPQTGRRYYGPDLFNRYARQFIERHKDRPFFLYYPLVLVHDEHTPTPDTRPRELFDQFETRKPAEYGHGTGDERIYFPDMVRYMDKMVGKILDTLEETGVRDNTLVVLMADNGTKECFAHILADGSRYEGGKGSTAESGTRVPLLMQYPDRIPAGTRYSGLVDVTDILPTLCQVAGIQLPAKEAIDGVSFWPQVSGRMMKPHRSSIYTWYNANRSSRDIDERLAYAHTTLFKRYAPHKGFPEGRFFDLRVDPHEREGKAVVKYKWDDWHHTGLDITELTEEQKAAYDHLGEVLEANAYVPVTALQLPAGPVMMEVGETLPITCRILPANATRQNLIWKSSNPAVASVDKFGVLRARASGHIRLTVFSWEDAYPTAANQDESYLTSGIQNHIDIEVID
jgi:arylsulfatase A-like enzyme